VNADPDVIDTGLQVYEIHQKHDIVDPITVKHHLDGNCIQSEPVLICMTTPCTVVRATFPQPWGIAEAVPRPPDRTLTWPRSQRITASRSKNPLGYGHLPGMKDPRRAY